MIGRTNAGGGGGVGGSELVIVGGTTRPAKATHNMIWINTAHEITDYVLSATEPANPVNGMAWVVIGDNGNITVHSPIGGDWITVYPLSAKQYINGAWVDVQAKSYQNGEWVDWIDYIVNNGVTDYSFSVIDKTWNAGNSDGSNNTTVTQQDGYISVKGQKVGYGAAYVEKDLTGKKSITIEGTFPVNANSLLAVWSSAGAYVTANMVASVQLSATGATLNIPELSGKMLVGITTVYTNEWKIVNMYLK